MRIPALAVLSLLAGPALAADLPNTAVGTFKSQSITMDVRSAVACRGRSSLDKGEALIVAVGNARLNAEAIFEITLVTPVMADDHGAALPPDGGAPGSAYCAYHAALVKADGGALKPLVSSDQQQYWDDSEKKGSLGAVLHAMANARPVKSVQITRGFSGGDKAVLEIAGESAGGKLVGEVFLVKEGDGWRVDDEITAIVP